MKLLIDTNIILDVRLARKEFEKDSKQILALVYAKIHKGYLCATSITNIYYILRKFEGATSAINFIHKLLEVFHVAEVDYKVLAEAASAKFADFEDAVQYSSAVKANLDGIVTRDKKGFKSSKIKIYSPSELIKIM